MTIGNRPDNETVVEWLRYARADLHAAQRLLDDEDTLRTIPCFHAQQAAEKALKALLIFYEINFPKTHDLVVLNNLLGNDTPSSSEVHSLRDLTQWAVESRYPGEVSEPSDEAARRAVEQAKSVVDEVQKKVDEGTAKDENPSEG